MKPNDITHAVIGAAIKVHSGLGPGLLESAYRAWLCQELTLNGLRYERELALPITYRGCSVEAGYRLNLLVEDTVVVELKAASRITGVHQEQLLSYLRLSKRSMGLLIHFHVKELRQGITRMVNSFRG